MDYERTEIAASYDRARALTPEALSLWRRLLTRDIDRAVVSRVADAGCGTGRFSELLAEEFNCQVGGVDPSKKMLGEARRKLTGRGIIYVDGSGEAPPLRDSSVDLVFMLMVYHHFADTAAAARECQRVLCCGGYAKDGHLILQDDHLITRANAATYADTRLIVCLCKGHHGWKKWHEREYIALVRTLLSHERVKLWDACERDSWKPNPAD
jgi:ubiquinone/menaquinone biosynthesis C-methylase UbiE